eukprot:1631714-Prymnesium_polylepis.1
MATVSGRSPGEGSQRCSRCRLRARWPTLGRAGRARAACSMRGAALGSLVWFEGADLQLDVLRRQHHR